MASPQSMPWAEVWTRPGDAAYGRRILDVPVQTGGATRVFNGVGSGNMTLPKTYGRLNDILYTDPDTPGNGVWSTVRFFTEDGWLADWLPNPRTPAQSKDDPTTEFAGAGIETVVGFAQLEPWDWDGSVSFVSTFPDWVYGGLNRLSNPGFEESVCRPEVNEITLDAAVSGGTFTLTAGADTTSPIAWNATAFDVETELELFTVLIDDVVVTGSGQPDDPWVIEFVEPCEFAGGLIPNFASLTPAPGDSVLDRTQFGALQPNPWTKSQVISSGTPRVFGGYDSFRVTTAQAHTGTYSLLINPAPIGRRYAGAQQVVSTQAGGVYQASVWVYTASAGQTYRLVIRGVDEDIMTTLSGAGAIAQVTPAANTWTQISIPDVVAEDTVIIFRVANINISGNPAIFYVDDGEFNPGAPPSTVGTMWTDMYASFVDPVLRSPIVWDDGTGTDTPYLTFDFTGVNDSDGVAWADVHSLTFKPRMTGLQILAEFVRLGYEWQVVPDSIPLGTYLLRLFNPDGLGAVVPAGIIGGQADIRSSARFFAPGATALTVQGAGQLTGRAVNAALMTPFGRIETSALDQNITSGPDVLAAATGGTADFNRGAESLVYTLRPTSGMQQPLIDYEPGDIIDITDPGVVTADRRIASIDLAWDQSGVEYTVQLGSASLVGQAAVNNMVDILWRRFQRPEVEAETNPAPVLGGGGMMTVAVAASNASASSQSKADIVCSGVNDHAQIMEAMEICWAAGGGTVWLSEGRFEIAGDQVIVGYSAAYPEPIILRGLGYGTVISFDGFTNFAVFVAQDCALKDCKIAPAGVG